MNQHPITQARRGAGIVRPTSAAAIALLAAVGGIIAGCDLTPQPPGPILTPATFAEITALASADFSDPTTQPSPPSGIVGALLVNDTALTAEVTVDWFIAATAVHQRVITLTPATSSFTVPARLGDRLRVTGRLLPGGASVVLLDALLDEDFSSGQTLTIDLSALNDD